MVTNMETFRAINPRSASEIDWSGFREQMPVAKKWAYFDHACVAPIPQVAADAIAKWAHESLLEGDVVWKRWESQHENLRHLTAQVINAAPQEIALVPNTTFGINLVADGFPWVAGDNVVLPAHEFPSNVYPWMALAERGVELRIVDLDGHAVTPQRIADACDDRTRIVSSSWIGYASGYRIDPAEIAQVAHDHDALFFLDAIQGLGVHALDVQAAGVDFLAADGHKWLLGPEGAGVFYCRRDLLEMLRPMNVGWNSVKQGNDFSRVDLDVRDSANRYEGGTQNMVGFIGLNASLQLLMDFGLSSNQSPIAEKVLAYSDEVCAALESAGAIVLSDRGHDTRSGIISFDIPGRTSDQVKSELLGKGVVVSQRAGRLRVSAHCYNDDNDLDRLVEAVRASQSAP
jgi:selenocysteine lyase/cysteine desulfurase